MASRESSWQGRAEGLDISRSHDIDSLRDSIRVAARTKKNAQRGDLPPISDVSNNAVCTPYLFPGSDYLCNVCFSYFFF